jgi:hypothetical protein
MIRVTTSLAFGALLWMPFAYAQTTLGALLDAGAKPLSAAEFKDELVQRVMMGPTPTGGRMEVMYVSNGTLQGVGSQPNVVSTMPPWAPVAGEWQADDKNRICTSMRVGLGPSGTTGMLILPARCQYWFKLGDAYFFADSDTDRSAKVLSRTIKQ